MAQARQYSPLSRGHVLLMLMLTLASAMAGATPRAQACTEALTPRALPDSAASEAASQAVGEAAGEAAPLARFEQCVSERFGSSALPRAARCAADLAELPVILLYRVDGLSRAAAWADLQRAGQLDDGSEYARRAPLMLGFGYQGAGPQRGRESEWMRARQAEWTERCLSGRLPESRP